jgi:hypothetical protein
VRTRAFTSALGQLGTSARDYGARAVSANALAQLRDIITQSSELDPSEPFLVPCDRFDSIPPGAVPANWLLAAVLEEYERIGSFSSFYTGESGRRGLEIIRELGFGSAEMECRLSLLQERFGQPGE